MNIPKHKLAQRPRLYAALAGLLAVGLFMMVFAMLMALDQLSKLDEAQNSLTLKLQGMSLDTRNMLRRLDHDYAPDCSPANLLRLRQEVFASTYQADIGVHDEQQRLRCTAVMGVLPQPVMPPPPDAVVKTAQGDVHHINFRLPLLISDGRYTATVVRMGRFSTVVSPHALDDLFAIEEGILRLRLVDGTMMVAHRDPFLPAELTQRLGAPGLLAAPVHRYSWQDQAFLSSRQVKGTQYFSQFAVPLPRFWAAYAPRLGLVLLLALSAGLLVYWALVPVLQRWAQLDHRIAGLIRDENMLCMYQPIVDMQSGRPVGCEVLMRLRDGAEVLYPDRVLPAVERGDLCWELDAAVVRRAIRELCTFLPASAALKVSFNFFPKNVECQRLRGLIEGELVRWPASALRFDLEVIEQAEQSCLLGEIAGLKQAGYLVSIDDFGTGYSNLSSVKAMAPDYLKIDKSFVFEMEDASVRSSLIPEMVGIARAVGAKVVAEGIENEAQRTRLLAFGVDYGQGYLFARPMEIEAFVHYLQERPPG